MQKMVTKVPSSIVARYAIAFLFTIFGIVNLFIVVGGAYIEECHYFYGFCSDFHGCGLDCSESWSTLEEIGAFLFF
jgi:hypothetical protein